MRLFGLDGMPRDLELRDRRGLYDLAVTPDGRSLVTGGESGIVRIWDLSGEIHSEVLFAAP